jgi:hypothetical protein
MTKPATPYVIGCLGGALISPLLLYGLVTTTKYIHGQVFDGGKYPDSTVVLEWADAEHEKTQSGYKQFYGGHVYTVKRSDGLDVYCEIHIGSPAYNHDCGHLGRVQDLQTARSLWGHLEWTPDALIVGNIDNRGLRVPRSDFQTHR